MRVNRKETGASLRAADKVVFREEKGLRQRVGLSEAVLSVLIAISP